MRSPQRNLKPVMFGPQNRWANSGGIDATVQGPGESEILILQQVDWLLARRLL